MSIKEFFLWLAAIGAIFGACYLLSGYGVPEKIGKAADEIAKAADKIGKVADSAKDVADDISTADEPRDWSDIITKIAAGVGAVAAIAGGEAYRRKRKARKA